MKKILFLLFALLPFFSFAQVSNPNSAPANGAERVSNYTVDDAGNDRLEIANGTIVSGRFIPTLWSYRDTDNTYSLVLTSSIAPGLDTGTSPMMLFTAGIAPQLDLGAPSSGSYVWGPNGTTQNIVNRPVFQWRNNSARLMTILANGRVGIGTETPSALLHTVGSVRFQNLANQNNPTFMLGTDSNGNVYEYPVPSGGVGSDPDSDWLQPDNTFATAIGDVIYTNGSVGINVQNPTSNFHVDGTLRFENLANQVTPAYMLGTDSNGNVYEYPVPSGGVGNDPDSDWLQSDNTFATAIGDVIYTNGSVGINVQSPTSNLHLDGTLRLENLPNENNALYMLGTDADGNVAEYPVPLHGVIDSDIDWLKLDNTTPSSADDDIYTNGKVGINTNDFPTMVGDEDVSFYNLYVTGGILTEEVRVSLVEDWADYVFKEDYNLPTLEEVEEHIVNEGHLINIPSAEKVKENGIELAEMNKLLLEKVEELTLYVIDMNKKIEQQQQEIEKLKKESDEK